MSRITDADRAPPAGGQNGSRGDPPLVDELARAAELLRARSALWLQGVQLAARRTAWLVGLGLWAAFALAVATVTAMILLLRGLANGIAAWLGSDWAGDLGAGVLFFAAMAAALGALAARRRHRQLRRLQERFGP